MKLILSMWKKTAFNPDWKCSESHPHLALWTDDTKGEPNKAHYKGFNVVLNLSNMLRQTLTRHTSKSIKHQNWIKAKLKSVPVTSFFHTSLWSTIKSSPRYTITLVIRRKFMVMMVMYLYFSGIPICYHLYITLETKILKSTLHIWDSVTIPYV